MKSRFFVFLILSLILGTVSESQAQTNAKIDRLRQEMKRLERQIDANKNKERSLTEQLEDTEKEISLRTRLLRQLNMEVKSKEKEIQDAEKRLTQALASYSNLKEVIRKRVVSIYKRGQYSDWEVLVSLSSWNQALVWMRYQQRIIENDRRNLRQLKEREIQIREERDLIEKELKAKSRLAREAESEKRKSQTKKQEHQRLLSAIQKDKVALQEQLRKNRIALNEAIRQKIREDQQEQKATNTPSRVTQFAKLKGKLPWPVKGQVIAKYGRQIDPVLNIETKNLGIDIQASRNDNVKAVCEGEVKWVQPQRGMGNLVLLDHGSNCSTVYLNLGQVFVEAGDQVVTGDIIGQLDASSLLGGGVCHFQVWKDGEDDNPLLWLGKQ